MRHEKHVAERRTCARNRGEGGEVRGVVGECSEARGGGDFIGVLRRISEDSDLCGARRDLDTEEKVRGEQEHAAHHDECGETEHSNRGETKKIFSAQGAYAIAREE